MKHILLVCASGMSTSLMVKRMKTAAEEQGFECTIEAVGNAYGKCRFRTNDREGNVIIFGEFRQSVNILNTYLHAFGKSGDAGVSRCAIYFVNLRAARERFHNGVLSASATYDQYFVHIFRL